MLKINLGNSSCQFEGFVNSAEFFAQQRPDSTEQSSTVLNGAELNTFPWPLADNSVSSAKLIYTLELPHDNKSTLDLMMELYRVCADGALVEIRAHTPTFLRALDFPLPFNIITERTMRFFDRAYRDQLQANPATQFLVPTKSDGSPLDVNFKLLKGELTLTPAFLSRLQNQEFKTNASLNQALNTDPNAVKFQNYFLVAQKNPEHFYALANTADLPSFAVRIQDPSLKRYGSLALLEHGSWEPKLGELFIKILRGMAKFKSEYNQTLHFACVGANIGWYPLLAALAAPNVQVDSFEPSPDCVEIAKQNFEMNEVASRVNVHGQAVSDTCGKTDLFINKAANGSNSLVAQGDDNDKVSVDCTTLDQVYLNQNPDDWPSLLMLDTHGHEQKVFAGARTMFDRGYRPVIISEFAPSLLALRGECTFHHELVEKYGYTPYIMNNADNNQANLFVANLKFLDQAYEQLSKDNPNDRLINVVFVPEWIDISTLRPRQK